MRILDSIQNMLTSKSSVQMVANDPHMASEMLLIVRMMFADGELAGAELELFKQFCSTIFNIPEKDVPDVVRYLKDFGYETSGEQAAELFADMEDERKNLLLKHLIDMAKADDLVHEKEVRFIERVSTVLGFTPEQVQAAML